MATKHSLEGAAVHHASRPLCSGSPAISLAADLELCRTALPESLHRKFENIVPGLSIQHAAHDIPLVGPEVQQAFMVFSRNRVLRFAKVEGDCAILNHDRLSRGREKLFDRPNQAVGSHRRILAELITSVCDR